MKKVNLTIADRTSIGELFPEAFGIAEFRIKTGLIQKLSVTAEDVTAFGITQIDETTLGVKYPTATKEIELTDSEFEFIKVCIREADAAKKLNSITINVAIKFVEESPELFSKVTDISNFVDVTSTVTEPTTEPIPSCGDEGEPIQVEKIIEGTAINKGRGSSEPSQWIDETPHVPPEAEA